MNKQVEQIRAEIERLKNKNTEAFDCGCNGTKCAGYDMALDDLLSFIDTMPEEPVSEDLEKAAIEAFKQIVDNGKNSFLEIFKAGANWRKEQMMKDSISGEVMHCMRYWINTDEDKLQNHLQKFIGGEKVKVIIVKED